MINILDYIPKGKENAVSRAELCKRTGLPDRIIRRKVKELVKEGIPVLSSSRAKGYWLSDDTDEIGEFIREADSRARAEYLTTQKLRERYWTETGTETVEVRAHKRRVRRKEND